MAFPTPMAQPLDERQGPSPLQGYASWPMCEVTLICLWKIYCTRMANDGARVPNKYFNYCKVIMQLQQDFNHYSTPMNNINGELGIITVVCCYCYIHP